MGVCHLTQGALPDSLGRLVNLQVVLLNSRSDTVQGFTGHLPIWAGSLANGVAVTLDDNEFFGPVPAEWCSKSALHP